MGEKPLFKVTVPLWVRVLAFLRVASAVRRMRAARYMKWFTQKNGPALIKRTQDDFMTLITTGSVATTVPCDACGGADARRLLSGGVKCQACYERMPRFYGSGLGRLLGERQVEIDKLSGHVTPVNFPLPKVKS